MCLKNVKDVKRNEKQSVVSIVNQLIALYINKNIN